MIALEQGLDVRGTRARQVLTEWGWTSKSESLRLVGDRFSCSRLAVGRFWTSPQVLAQIPSSRSRTTLLFAVDGESQIEPTGERFTVGQALITEAATEIRYALDRPAAFVYASVIGGFGHRPNTTRGIVIDVPSDLRQLTLAFASSLLNSSSRLEIGHSSYVVDSMSSLLLNIYQLSARNQPLVAQKTHVDLDVVRTFLAENYADSTLDVGGIARSLNISRPHLFRLFKSAGTTPGRHLSRLRARHARELRLHGGDLGEHVIAERAGFPNIRTMHRAIDRLGDGPES